MNHHTSALANAYIRPRLSRFSLMLAYAFMLGATVRLAAVASSDFPIHDGGLFLVMIRDLQHNGYALPITTSFNGGSLPFAYPPLTFYLAGVLEDLTAWNLVRILTVLPGLVTLLTIPAFYRLARRFLTTELGVISAVIVYALLPTSYQWLIMGGGLTRAVGAVFALLTLERVHEAYSEGGQAARWLAILFGAATVLSHPEAAWFVVYSSAYFWLALPGRRKNLATACMVAGGVALLTAPWWLTLAQRHGPVLLQPAGASGVPWWIIPLRPLLLLAMTEAVTPIFKVLALTGLLYGLVARRNLLAGWLFAIYLLQLRGFEMRAAIPTALLAGVGVTEVALPLLKQALERTARPSYFASRLSAVALAGAGLYALISPYADREPWAAPLSRPEREAMAWVAARTPPDSTFVMLFSAPTDQVFWQIDTAGEWFPALANRTNVAVVQGYEWLPGFEERIARHRALAQCTFEGPDCVARWSRTNGIAFTHVYVPKPEQPTACCVLLRQAFVNDSGYVLEYDGPGASVFRRVATEGTAN